MRTFIQTLIIGTTALFAHFASAATISWIPAVGNANIGDKITAALKIDSEGAGINAAQATIRFPKEMLEVLSVDKTDSAFSFWLEEPTFSNTDGIVSFVGGTPYGISGASIKVIGVTFVVKNAGIASLSFADTAITASDGSGTNVLSKTTDAAFTISATKEAATPLPAAPLVVTPPEQIIRPVVTAENTPRKPVLSVALYPDPTAWHNVSNIFSAKWDLPRDITDVSTAINKQPNFSPGTSEGLFDSKSFSAQSDGIWYLHLRFKNTIGWGETAHYRIAVDTKAPLPFIIDSSESASSDNPSPVLSFKASDALSGLREYQIKIDNGAWVTIPLTEFKGSRQIDPLAPGMHQITIRAFDLAGNSIESGISAEILPIPSPSIVFVTERLFSDETKGLTIQGTALPDTEILLTLASTDGVVVEERTIKADTRGNWEYTYSNPLRNDIYRATIINRDARGARSLPIESPEIRVAERPIIQFGSFSLGKNGAITLLILILAGGFASGYVFYRARRERTTLRVSLAESDAAKVFKVIESDIDKLDNARTTHTPADDEFAVNDLREDVARMSGYLKKEIGKAKE